MYTLLKTLHSLLKFHEDLDKEVAPKTSKEKPATETTHPACSIFKSNGHTYYNDPVRGVRRIK